MKSQKILPLLFLAFLNNPLNSSQFQTTVENIINEFAQNSIVAEDQYMNKRINLTKGEILSIDDSVFSEFVGQNDVSVLIQPQPKNAFDFSFDTISCVHKRDESIVRKLRKGMKVDIQGLLIGEEFGLVFKDCSYTSADLKSRGNNVDSNSNRNGLQTKIYNNGDKYVGDFVDGKRTGKGTYTWVSGNKYAGDFIDNKRTGKGTYTWVSGNKYVGDFIDGKRTGKGTYTWADGSKYVGDFVDGTIEGEGIYTPINGKILEGKFENGQLVKSYKIDESIVENDNFQNLENEFKGIFENLFN